MSLLSMFSYWKRRILRVLRLVSIDLFTGMWKKKHRLNNSEEIIVSLTSYPDRFEKLHYTIKSILWQKTSPNRIILYLGEDSRNVALPVSLTELTEHGLEIVYVEGDMGPHKKYLYAIKAFSDSIIITVDDDVLYPRDMITKMMAEHYRNPDHVICGRAHLIQYDDSGKIMPYISWKWEYKESSVPSYDIFPTGCGGVLYPPGIFEGTQLTNEHLINELCRNNDDVWLKWNYSGKKIKAVVAQGDIWNDCFDLYYQDIGLNVDNIEGGGNDEAIRRLENLGLWVRETLE